MAAAHVAIAGTVLRIICALPLPLVGHVALVALLIWPTARAVWRLLQTSEAVYRTATQHERARRAAQGLPEPGAVSLSATLSDDEVSLTDGGEISTPQADPEHPDT